MSEETSSTYDRFLSDPKQKELFDKEYPELKPCPFCNGKARTLSWEGADEFYVMCCDCKGKTRARFLEKEKAIKAWNRRADGWISVESEIPGEGQQVLLLFGGKERSLGYWNNRWYINSEYPGYEVSGVDETPTHWMELPELQDE